MSSAQARAAESASGGRGEVGDDAASRVLSTFDSSEPESFDHGSFLEVVAKETASGHITNANFR